MYIYIYIYIMCYIPLDVNEIHQWTGHRATRMEHRWKSDRTRMERGKDADRALMD